ncbi:MAG TPA: hypothetical protein DCZ95_08565 [Verrucomicrobia bacterium]|nr:MAG: hypothetical protein A2X46_12600 [Lentisphaerae bacterium GWF2_57_35]HBA84131.1 hypothetical protein [Verrucomicrobiota bacterium]
MAKRPTDKELRLVWYVKDLEKNNKEFNARLAKFFIFLCRSQTPVRRSERRQVLRISLPQTLKFHINIFVAGDF